MKTHAPTDPAEKRPPHLTYSAFCLAAKDRSCGFSRHHNPTRGLTAVAKNANCFSPVKRKRSLLESNPPRDNWIEGRRNKNVSTFGETQTSPNANRQTFISEPEYALKNSSKTISKNFRDGQHQQKQLRKNYVSSYPFFRSKRTRGNNRGGGRGGLEERKEGASIAAHDGPILQ